MLCAPVMRILGTILSFLLSVVLTLAAVGALLMMTRSIEQMTNRWVQVAAVGAAVCIGSLLLVGSVFLATKLVVFFSPRERQ